MKECEVRSLIRDIFSRFQNLNLVFLMEDLRNCEVASGDWQTLGEMCPIAHGWTRCLENAESMLDDIVFKFSGIPEVVGRPFIRWWDGRIKYETAGHTDSDTRNKFLLTELESIYAERLADLDAVQRVLECKEGVTC